MANLDGKIALITGAASGQGAAEARAFAAAGAAVIVADIDEAGRDLAATLGGQAIFQRLDVGEAADWAAAMELARERFGRLDVLVNNAGIYKPRSFLETDEALWTLHYRVNQLGPFLGMRAAADVMRASGGGAIVNTASFAAMGAYPGQFAYGATKWALRGMTRLAAVELAPFGIRVNGIYPGMIDTPMLAENDPAQLRAFASTLPMGRAGTPDEVAELALFLASDAASYISGAEITITGGLA
jgi:3alpha(or 20beta)-hydroxysteroid dehydrogenase